MQSRIVHIRGDRTSLLPASQMFRCPTRGYFSCRAMGSGTTPCSTALEMQRISISAISLVAELSARSQPSPRARSSYYNQCLAWWRAFGPILKSLSAVRCSALEGTAACAFRDECWFGSACACSLRLCGRPQCLKTVVVGIACCNMTCLNAVCGGDCVALVSATASYGDSPPLADAAWWGWAGI